jgi:two-component system sensor histidine kinase HydH
VDIHTQATLLAAIVLGALAGAALLRDDRPRVFTLFAVFAANLSIFSFADFLHRWPELSFGRGAFERIAVVGGALTPATGLAFFLEFLGVARRPARRARNAMLVGSLTGIVVAVSPLVHLKVAKLAVTAYVVGGMLAVLSVLWGRMHAAPSRVERARLAYLFFGACVAVLLSTLDVLPRLGVPYPLEGLGAITLTLFMFFLSQTLQRLRLLDLHEFLGKIVVVSALALVLVVVYGGLVSWVGNRPELFAFNTVVASFVILSLFEPLRSKIEEWVVVTLFRERYELVRQLERLRDRAATVIDPSGLAVVVLDGLEETRRVTHASLWLLADDRPGYRLLDARGPRPAPFLEPPTARALLNAIGSGRKALLLETIERRMKELRALLPPNAGAGDSGPRGTPSAIADELVLLADARAAMATMKAGIAMPLAAGDRVVGFLSCWDERVPEAFASNEIAALIEVADRCALVIENSKLYQQMKERDRLAAIGEMAAGLAHEIRNPLAAIKGAIQLILPPGKDGRGRIQEGDPEQTREFLEIIVEEVNRLNGVVTQFLDYSRPVKASLAPGDVNEILQRTLKLLSGRIPPAVELAIDLAPDLPRVSCDPEQLRQVFLNLALNALEAMPDGGRLTVETRLARDELSLWRDSPRRNDLVEIRFRDTGPGIPEEARDHVFVPFYTTKEKGTGLGLAICQRIVKSHGGTIGIRPTPAEGTEFVVSLPAVAAERAEPRDPERPAPAPGGSGRRRRRLQTGDGGAN